MKYLVFLLLVGCAGSQAMQWKPPPRETCSIQVCEIRGPDKAWERRYAWMCDDYGSELRGDMNISGADIPKSTLLVGGVLWSILFAMQAWHLITTLNMKDRQTEQSGDIRVVTLQQATMSDDIKDLKQIVAAHELRLSEQERRRWARRKSGTTSAATTARAAATPASRSQTAP